jgi:hypothetical protein
MDRDQLIELLKACTHLTATKTVFTASEDAAVDVLLNAGTNGPAPISRVRVITLGDAFIELKTEDNMYLLPHSAIFGLKWAEKEARSSRTGFHA